MTFGDIYTVTMLESTGTETPPKEVQQVQVDEFIINRGEVTKKVWTIEQLEKEAMVLEHNANLLLARKAELETIKSQMEAAQ
jgi:hypothetical protein